MKKNAAKAAIVAALAFAGLLGAAGPALAADSVSAARSAAAAASCTDSANFLAGQLRTLGVNVPQGAAWQDVYLRAHDWAARHPGATAEAVRKYAEHLRAIC